MNLPPVYNEPGWAGAFTRNEVLGAWRNGTRIVKVNSDPTDGTPDGTKGTVLGSIMHKEVMDGLVMYFVEWDDKPRIAVACAGTKIAPEIAQ